MKQLHVWIEIKGTQTYVGDICGESVEDSCFSYAKEYYMESGNKPISIHLPFSGEAFSPKDTRNFFEGLLPEGFTRRCRHMGCMLDWNPEESTWECSCHGTGCYEDGRLKDNPAQMNLK